MMPSVAQQIVVTSANKVSISGLTSWTSLNSCRTSKRLTQGTRGVAGTTKEELPLLPPPPPPPPTSLPCEPTLLLLLRMKSGAAEEGVVTGAMRELEKWTRQ